MKRNVTLSDFQDAFKGGQYENNFSYAGLEILFEYLEMWESDTGTEVELDVVAFACEYSESAVTDVIDDYSIDVSHIDMDADGSVSELCDFVTEYLSERTSVCGCPDDLTIIYAAF